jgi:hypothetical protein
MGLKSLHQEENNWLQTNGMEQVSIPFIAEWFALK